MRRSITCTTMLSLYFFLFLAPGSSASIISISPGKSLRHGETLVSESGNFEMAFFRPGNSKNWYLGIRYGNVSTNDVVWVANREAPLIDRSGVLSVTSKGVLVLLNGNNRTIWSSNATDNSQNPVLQLQDSGNLVLKDKNGSDLGNVLWQSFDHPCDTFLSGMKIVSNSATGEDRFLTSWKTADDPAPGQFSFRLDPRGFPQVVVRNGTSVHYRLGSWNGIHFTGTPELQPNQFLKYEFQLSKNEVYYGIEVQGSLMTRLLVNQSGFVERFARLPQSTSWKSLYFAPRDQCDIYSLCGAHMTCNIVNNSAQCDCLEGFRLKPSKGWSDGCDRRTLLDCSTDVFKTYPGLKLPDTSLSWFNTSMNLTECKARCLRNCNCTAYANSDINGAGNGCLLWFGDLLDMRQYSTGGQDLYIRMPLSRPDGKRVVGIIVGCAILLGAIVVGLILYLWHIKRRKQGKGQDEDMELPLFNMSTVAKATDNFSSANMLGKGGFGPVYKGILADETEIAVKRLSKSSGQGMTEFKNEVILIAKLQHRNLVKLLGCCIEGDEKILIYEFMPNKSLDYFIFDQIRSKFLDWHKRFLIIGGIARGLLYLHQDSRLRIIHRDLKASNVLLDKDMNPKISDFGLARMFGADESEANTNKVVGTYGYMAPEYAVDGHFSTKSDVFSFGVLVLEIISGKKNRGFSHPDHNHNLLGHAWKLWMEEKTLDLVDSALEGSYVVTEVQRCIRLGLLCVQQRPDDRPNMSSVVLMLGSDSLLPEPKQPGFFTERNIPEVESSSSVQKSSSVNEVTISLLDPR